MSELAKYSIPPSEIEVYHDVYWRIARLISAAASNYVRGMGWIDPIYFEDKDEYQLNFRYKKVDLHVSVKGEQIRVPMDGGDTITAYWIGVQLNNMLEERGIDWRREYRRGHAP